MGTSPKSAAGPRRMTWKGNNGYVPLLEGPPATCGMRSGRVSLKAGEDVGEHSTGDHEEIVIVLEGRGVACAAGRDPLPVEAGQAVYVPPHTTHNMKNPDAPLLRYIYVVAPVPRGAE